MISKTQITQERGFEAVKSKKGYHVASEEELDALSRTNQGVRELLISSWVLTNKINEYGGPVAVSFGYGGYWYLGVIHGERGPDLHGWVVLVPDASEATTPQSEPLRPTPTILRRRSTET